MNSLKNEVSGIVAVLDSLVNPFSVVANHIKAIFTDLVQIGDMENEY